ncbi:ImmA/IrrE family metallo-endopeptidase [Verminephrobacter aporrectodeae subsp. tuberculatae]|uniref:ImmA/IrrE family metallo-endopeptidase n=2 Tax=Verminephrobacter TaxID=364316 RepID=A0ABT3KW87_9BURK|nr:ImmA/IrrE family metallo-endopeptidase [Verminephrobacter aporrectodeae subsp. tuberculatae]MCW8164285.1 ImmA/IrrE family metallo-endopeptidase [Verminephrobacter aporrectodeae subsp. tuberculatae]MCW8168540.1 ImmA/IrrE family metallo-endopeptidase [Verminephrobacter aporrectodeae subsp. tuberculatae]MCW8199352.1 ImmA/IrrE family metallo-endopeptidase [Verminephrobacter aporrectodeae subsp. tuberculatae]
MQSRALAFPKGVHMKTAQQILDAYWDGMLPINPIKIASAMGIKVKSDPFLPESGSVEVIDGTVHITYNSAEQSNPRWRFTVAHEIGHYALGHLDRVTTKMFRDPVANFSTGAQLPEERQANHFAAQLLMPERIVKYVMMEKGVSTIQGLASLFRVSQVAMKWRLVNLGMIRG